MIYTIITYILACVAAAFVAPVVAMLFSPLYTIARNYKSLTPIVTFTISAISMFLAMYGLLYVVKSFGVTPTLLMFLLPWCGVIDNDFRRVKAARGKKNLTFGRVPDGFDVGLQLRMEYGFIVGDTIGLWTPLLLLGDVRFW